jgi:hypothetical protein
MTPPQVLRGLSGPSDPERLNFARQLLDSRGLRTGLIYMGSAPKIKRKTIMPPVLPDTPHTNWR